jgi:hypothetical protein
MQSVEVSTQAAESDGWLEAAAAAAAAFGQLAAVAGSGTVVRPAWLFAGGPDPVPYGRSRQQQR